MGERSSAWRGMDRAAISILLVGLVAACAEMGTTEPAPVYMKGGAAEAGPIAPPQRHEVRVTVRPGQSVRGLAHAYHVSERAIIAANRLAPPYKIKIGQSLVIPGALESSPVQTAALPPKTIHEVPPAVRQAPLSVPPPPIAAAPTAAAPASPPPVAASSGQPPIRDIISLDDPPPPPPKAIAFPNPPPERPVAAPQSPPAITPPTFSSGPAQATREPRAAEEARTEAANQAGSMHGGRFAWPVRGRVVAAYGVSANGTHNDGINIAAPKGAPIAAIEGGVVAYAGNELRGYGNLVLIKHPDGLISAYAHCEELLVKRGEQVHAGQIIAKVGATGGLSEPQLHFEVRRGKKAVDPREFLSPAPSAGTANPAG
jgi:murein DD-endopeptidase MepM/ murein hydrolase activator NlpD